MSMWGYLLAVTTGIGGLFLITGRWRLLFWPVAIRPHRMTVGHLGLDVTDPTDIERVNSILNSFAGGFNTALLSPSSNEWRVYCEALSSINRPFAHEGAAMAYVPRHLLHYDPEQFENDLVRQRPGFRYLYYVGLGFWWGMRKVSPSRVMRMTRTLDPLHQYLCYDGYGFSQAFFHYRTKPQALRRLDLFDGYARNAAYQGVGRAFYFLFHSNPEKLTANMESLGDMARDAASGMGLAAAFVNPDRLDRAQGLALRLPRELWPDFHLGLCFGMKARSINDLDQFENELDRLDPDVQAAVRACIRTCDRVELLVRDRIKHEPRFEAYQAWRTEVTSWMAKHITYPLQGLTASSSARVGHAIGSEHFVGGTSRGINADRSATVRGEE